MKYLNNLQSLEQEIEHYNKLLTKSEEDYLELKQRKVHYEDSFFVVAQDHHVTLISYLHKKLTTLSERLNKLRDAPNPEFVDLLTFNILFRMNTDEVYEETISAHNMQTAIDVVHVRYNNASIVDVKVMR